MENVLSDGILPPARPRAKIGKSKDEQVLADWFRTIPPSGQAKPLTRPRLKAFFQTSERLISLENPAITHRAIQDLASNGGLLRIAELTQTDPVALQPDEQVQIMDTLFLPLLRTITHRDVISSLMLEKAVGDIYVFLYGIAGRRALAFFTSLSAVLKVKLDTTPDGKLYGCASTVLTALLQVLECNQTACLQEAFQEVVDVIQSCFDSQGASSKGTLSEQTASQNMRKLRRYLNHGSSIQPVQTPAISHLNDKAAFELVQDLPGILSSAGPRHDNDHAEIKAIKILPTAQEIRALRAEYLPVNDPSKWHIDGINGLLDQQFRLLREDTVGLLRDCVRLVMEDLLRTGPRHPSEKEDFGLRIYKYSNVTFSDISFDKRKILKVMASFDQPPHLARRSAAERRVWWYQCRRLQLDSLVCLVDSEGHSLFFSVCDREGFREKGAAEPQLFDQVAPSPATGEPARKGNLFSSPEKATVTLRLIDIGDQDFKQVLGRDFTSHSPLQVLVEFPGVLLPSFQPTLEALQRMSMKAGDIPFSAILAPLSEQQSASTSWPAYATQPGFAFDFSPITRQELKNSNPLRLAQGKTFNTDTLKDRTTLDDAQCTALIGALSRDLALIQGPPGTGKSFVAVQAVKVLLNSRLEAEMNPIICVCYTNHALDQFLEHILADGTNQIVRIGARSKSSLLQPFNMHSITRQMEETKSEKSLAWKLRRKLESEGDEIATLFRQLRRASTPTIILEYLELEHPDHHHKFVGSEDTDGFYLVRNQRGDPLRRWLHEGVFSISRPRPLSELAELPLNTMSAEERLRLYDYWTSEIRDEMMEQLEGAIKRYMKTDKDLLKCNQEIRLRCLKQAHVVGITTSGLAKNVDLLRRLKPKVVLCEEAGEILEAHTLTAFLPSVEHAILIGDHEQLRPQVQNYDLSMENPRGEKYSLDMSTFERLITTPELDVAYDTLQTQRRMDPSISELIRKTIYPSLKDHVSVITYPPVPGLRKRLYWLDHRERENVADPLQVLQTSQSNDYEVELVRALATHLVRQGAYRGRDIVVLTPYVRQLQKLRYMLSETFEIVVEDKDEDELEQLGDFPILATDPRQTHRAVLTESLRIATIDNFQGEESDVVIVSLVRSNIEKRCGFLRTTNRINVLLSRAKHGMYIIGNSETYSHVPMWLQVIKTLNEFGNMGFSLPLHCSQHPDTVIEVTTPEDFLRKAPEGGCSEQCNKRLGCDHICTFKCHSPERHESVVCQAPCERRHKKCGHICTKHCGLECGRCIAPVDVQLPCGHVKSNVQCSKSSTLVASIQCQTTVEQTAPGCGHKVKLRCGKTTVDPHFVCTIKCGADLPCGHQCLKPCNSCDLRGHGCCTNPCGLTHKTCTHECDAACHGEEPCPPCKEPCSVHCRHTTCNKQCHEPCNPCAEPCNAGCVHQGFCTKPCAVPCNVLPCSRRCEKLLACGHSCPSACGEPCPDWVYCQDCANPTIKQTIVNHIQGVKYQQVDLENNPIIVPACGHLMDIASMDAYIDTSAEYDITIHLSSPALRSDPPPLSVGRVNECPVCQGSLADIHRYYRLSKRALLDQSTKRIMISANAKIIPLTLAMQLEERALITANFRLSERRVMKFMHLFSPTRVRIGGPRGVQLHNISQLSGLESRYERAFVLQNAINAFFRKVSDEERPFERVWAGQAGDINELGTVLQTRTRLLAKCLLLRCEYAILADIVKIHRAQNKHSSTEHEWLTRDLSLDLHFNRMDCLEVAHHAKQKQQPMVEVEAHLLFAKFVALERMAPAPTSRVKQILTDATQEIHMAKEVVLRSPIAECMLPEIKKVESMLCEEFFYTMVVSQKRQALYRAMVQESTNAETWCYCVNMHLFTMEESAAIMNDLSCPQCGEAVKGHGQESSEDTEEVLCAADLEDGFEHVGDLEDGFGCMGL